MKHLLLLGTGGTIACKRGENGLTPLLTGDELLSYVPDAKKFCEVETVQVLNIDSTNMHPKHWLKLAQVLEENYDDYDGFVICHAPIRWPTPLLPCPISSSTPASPSSSPVPRSPSTLT